MAAMKQLARSIVCFVFCYVTGRHRGRLRRWRCWRCWAAARCRPWRFSSFRAPAELVFGRALRTSLETLRPSTRTAVESRQAAMKQAHDRRAQDRSFSTGDALLLWDPQRHQTRWMTGEVIAVVLSRAAQ